ncbi:tetratricopeptide repeat protein [Streptomyces oceani]|uniref:Uncharacterized protein n=1 Tax=Streptomyces oceani TaxID=1075402 RepID=A0A1E7KIH7_9ACTN|nr:tetratricopeptide repeat protein [Streptomyces oceani]OEV03705.1 hypothetical protein AN216_10685 [Streptomyces oceani]
MGGSSQVDNDHEARRAAFRAFAERSRTGDRLAALAAAHAAHDQVAAVGHAELRGVALNCVGLAQFELGEFASAAESHQRAKDLSRRSDVRGFAALRASLARIAAGESTAYPQVWEVDSAPGQLAALARSEHPHLAPAAGVELGRVLRGERHFLAAIRAYRSVVDSGHPWCGPRAAAPLAELLREAGDHEGAARVLDQPSSQADASDLIDLALAPLDDPEAPPCWLAPVRPGLDHYRAGDLSAARSELRATAASDWRPAACQANALLAGIELLHGEPTTARQLLGDLAESADFTHGPRAAVALAILEAAAAAPQGTTTATDPVSALGRYLTRDPDATTGLRALAQEGHPLAGMFAALLSDLLRDVRPGSEAASWHDLAMRSGDGPAAGYASYLTATDLTSWEDAERVVDALAAACETTTVLPWAAVRLGEASLADLYGGGESLYSFQDALGTGHRALLPRAAAGLFDSSPADSWSAEQRYALATELLAGDPPTEAVPPLAWLAAETLIRFEDDLDGGRAALERIPDSDPEFGAPASAVRLLLDEDVDGMRSVFEWLARWDERSLEWASECCVSVLWEFPDEATHTRQALQVLADLGHPSELADKASERLIKVCEIQHDLDGELAAREASKLRRDGYPGAGIAEVARRHHLAGDLDRAVELYQRVNTPEFPEARGGAAVDLGVLFRHQGRHEEARALLATGVPAKHCFTLGKELEGAGRIDEAVLAWELIVDTDDATWAVRANYFLGRAHAERGESDAAITAYQRAAATRDSYFRGMAWHQLGCLYQEQGDLESAKQAQQRGAEVGARLEKDGDTVVSVCELRLGELATLSGDSDEARRRYLDMAGSADRGTAAMGAMMLGGEAKDRRDVAEARHWYQRVIDSGDLFQRELAVTHLGELYYWVDAREQSREFYERTLDSGRSSPELVAEAAYRLGEMASQDGDTDQAVRHLARARDTGDAEFSSQASRLLGQLTD